jgi:hypothetical protein
MVLALVFVGAVVLAVVLIFANLAEDGANYIDIPDYGDSHFETIPDDSHFETIPDDSYFGPPLEEARAGDVVLFGGAQWRGLDEDLPEARLLLREYAVYLPPEEIEGYLNGVERSFEAVYMGGMEFTAEEFARIAPPPEGDGLFLLTPEEMERYGAEPPEAWDDGRVPVRPALRVYVR